MHEGARGGIRSVAEIEELMATTPRYDSVDSLSAAEAVTAEDPA